MLAKNLFCILFGFFFALQAFSAGEVLPAFKNEAKKSDYMLITQRQIPFSAGNIDKLIRIQTQGLQVLRSQFPQYDQWMKEKPDPISIMVSEIETQKTIVSVLNENTLTYVQNSVAEIYSHEISQAPINLNSVLRVDWLRERALQSLLESLIRIDSSVRGLFTGLATILSAEEKDVFFKLGDPQQQLTFLKRQSISDETLRQSKFHAETIGLNSQTYTYQQVLEVAQTRIRNIQEAFIKLSYLKSLSQMNSSKTLPALQPIDFDFAVTSNSEFWIETRNALTKLHPERQSQILQSHATFLNDFSRLHFLTEEREVQSLRPLAKVTEVHPHLGVYRGCIGGDCSTSRSSMFPYSPWEHIFFIQDPSGAFLGYISATRVLTNKVSSFYLKDLSGPHLSAKIGEATLQALRHTHTHYGTERFVVADPRFTHGQNHFPVLQNMLAKYSNNKPLTKIEFPDAKVRETIGSNSTFSSTSQYDSIQVHGQGVVVPEPETTSRKYEFVVNLETLPVPEIKKYSELMLEALRGLLTNPRLSERNFNWLPQNELTALKAIFQNRHKIPLKSFYEEAKNKLKNLEIEMDSEFVKHNDWLFAEGHLAASDATTSRIPAEVNETEKIFIRLAKLHTNYNVFIPFAQSAKSLLEESSRMKDLIELYKLRMQDHDTYQLIFFAHLGYKGIGDFLSLPKNQSAIEVAVENLIQNDTLDLGTPSNVAVFSTFNTYLTILRGFSRGEPNNRTNLQTKELLRSAFALFHLNSEKLQNPLLRGIQIKAFLQTSDAYSSENIMQTLQYLKEGTKESLISRTELIRGLASYFRGFQINVELTNYINDFLKTRVNQILNSLSETDLIELYSLKFMGLKSAIEATQRPEVHQAYLALIQKFFDIQSLTPEAQMLMRDTQPFADSLAKKWESASRVISRQSTNVSSIGPHLDDISTALGLAREELLNIPELRKKIALKWISSEDAYIAQDKNLSSFAYSLLFEGIVYSNPRNFNWSKFINHHRYLSQKREFKPLLEKLSNAFVEGRCDHCAMGLVQLIVGKGEKDLISEDLNSIKKLLSSDQPLVATYGAFRAIERGHAELVTENVLAMVLKIAPKGGVTTNIYVRESMQSIALEVLARTSSNSTKARSAMIELVRNESINQIALKAGIAYVAHNGSPLKVRFALNQKFDRTELTDEDSNNLDRLLYQKFIEVTAPKNGSKTYNLLCKELFSL